MILGAERLRDLVDLAVLLSLPGVIVLAWLVGRLLGVRRSWTTTIASGVIGWIGGVALALAIAGKEAASKAIGTGWSRGVRWRDVVVNLGPPPSVNLHGRAADVARSLGGSGRTRTQLEFRGPLAVGQVQLLS